MKGNVLGFDPESNTGAISGHDGQRYDFVRIEWRGQHPPARGATVDFVADGGRATQIYPLGLQYNPQDAATANTVYVLYLLGIVLPITAVIGVVMAYVNHDDAPQWVRTHYRVAIRTFWIGLLYALIGAVLCFIIIGFFWLGFVLVWWIVRCVKGMQAISRGMPYDRPASWLW